MDDFGFPRIVAFAASNPSSIQVNVLVHDFPERTSLYFSDTDAVDGIKFQGVYANCTLALATTFSSTFFRVWGAIYAVATLLLWVYVAVQTVRMCPSGCIFDALPMEEEIGRNGDLLEGEKAIHTTIA